MLSFAYVLQYLNRAQRIRAGTSGSWHFVPNVNQIFKGICQNTGETAASDLGCRKVEVLLLPPLPLLSQPLATQSHLTPSTTLVPTTCFCEPIRL